MDKMENKQYIEPSDWDDFRNTGLMWLINQILHAFGWVIVVEYENSKVINAYPARTKYRGFSIASQEKNYLNIAKYMASHGEELEQEAKDAILDNK